MNEQSVQPQQEAQQPKFDPQELQNLYRAAKSFVTIYETVLKGKQQPA